MNFYPRILSQETKQTNQQTKQIIKTKNKNNNGTKKSVNKKMIILIEMIIIIRLLITERMIMRTTEIVMKIKIINLALKMDRITDWGRKKLWLEQETDQMYM